MIVGPQTLHHSGDGFEKHDVACDRALNTRTQYFDGDFASVRELAKMNLCDRRARYGIAFEAPEHLANALPEAALDLGDRGIRRKWRHLILQLGQLVRDVRWQQVAARGKQLAKLDENRSERFERPAQPYAARRTGVGTQHNAGEPRHIPGECTEGPRRRHQGIQAEAQRDHEDAQESGEARHRYCRSVDSPQALLETREGIAQARDFGDVRFEFPARNQHAAFLEDILHCAVG